MVELAAIAGKQTLGPSQQLPHRVLEILLLESAAVDAPCHSQPYSMPDARLAENLREGMASDPDALIETQRDQIGGRSDLRR